MTKVEREVAARMNDSTEITIPLRNLVSMIAAASIATWAYFGLTERISFLEHNLELTMTGLITFNRLKLYKIL